MKAISDHKAAALGFAVTVAYWPGMSLASFVPRWAVIALGIGVVSTLDPRNIPEALRWSLLFLVALGAVSLLASPSPFAGVQDLLFVIFLCGVLLMGAELDSFDGVMRGVTVGLALCLAIVVWQHYGVINLPHSSAIPGSLFDNSEICGEFAALVFVWGAAKRKLAPAIIGGALVAVMQSRVGVLAGAVGLFYAFRPRSLAVTGAIGLLIVIGGFAMLFLKLGNAEHRIVLWGATAMSLKFLGNGLGWGGAAFPYEEFVHSDALQAVAELGVGAAALLVIPFMVFRGSRGSHAERALFLAICVEVLVSFPLHFPASGFLAAAVAGYLVSTRGLVRGSLAYRQLADGPRDSWWAATGRAIAGGGRPRHRALSVRSISASLAALDPRAIGACAAAAGFQSTLKNAMHYVGNIKWRIQCMHRASNWPGPLASFAARVA